KWAAFWNYKGQSETLCKGNRSRRNTCQQRRKRPRRKRNTDRPERVPPGQVSQPPREAPLWRLLSSHRFPLVAGKRFPLRGGLLHQRFFSWGVRPWCRNRAPTTKLTTDLDH